MNIIFGDPRHLTDKYTVLELDTFKSPTTGDTMTAFCVVESIPLSEMAALADSVQTHADLIKAYKAQHWHYCKQAIELLNGKWNKDLDSFYNNLLERVNEYEVNQPTEDWDGSIVKEVSSTAAA